MRRGSFRGSVGVTAALASRALALKVGLLAGAAVLAVLFVIGLFVASSSGAPTGGAEQCRLVGAAGEAIPANYLPWLRRASAQYQLGARGFSIVAAIHKIESDFGRSSLPGVSSGTNFAGAAGPGQFLAETWAAYGVDADRDGDRDVYSVPDSVLGTANYLRASGAPRDWHTAIFAYNHAEWYVNDVESTAGELGGKIICTPAAPRPGGQAFLKRFETLYGPLGFKAIPAKLWIGGGDPQAVDERIWANVVWVLETFSLRVTAARESGHETHGDGTAIDLVPATGKDWDSTALAAAEALGWRSECGASGTAPVCPLVPAIQFIGYNGYPSHGDPAHAGSNAHLHISWDAASFGCSGLCSPPRWVRVFPLSP